MPAVPLPTLAQIHDAAQLCRGCPLYKRATQAVTAERGDLTLSLPARGVKIMLIGEQPGDQEDRQGHPFVGPAGGLLDGALAEAGIERSAVVLTNAVRHFKWTPAPTGKRRLHARPSPAEVRACRPWLVKEIEVVRPRVIVALGATAAQALLGPAFRITRDRGRLIEAAEWGGAGVVATFHPSAVLRAPTADARHQQRAALVADLKAAGAAAQRGVTPRGR